MVKVRRLFSNLTKYVKKKPYKAELILQTQIIKSQGVLPKTPPLYIRGLSHAIRALCLLQWPQPMSERLRPLSEVLATL